MYEITAEDEREGGGIQFMNVTNETVNDCKLKLLLIIRLALGLFHPKLIYIFIG